MVPCSGGDTPWIIPTMALKSVTHYSKLNQNNQFAKEDDCIGYPTTSLKREPQLNEKLEALTYRRFAFTKTRNWASLFILRNYFLITHFYVFL